LTTTAGDSEGVESAIIFSLFSVTNYMFS